MIWESQTVTTTPKTPCKTFRTVWILSFRKSQQQQADHAITRRKITSSWLASTLQITRILWYDVSKLLSMIFVFKLDGVSHYNSSPMQNRLLVHRRGCSLFVEQPTIGLTVNRNRYEFTVTITTSSCTQGMNFSRSGTKNTVENVVPRKGIWRTEITAITAPTVTVHTRSEKTPPQCWDAVKYTFSTYLISNFMR